MTFHPSMPEPAILAPPPASGPRYSLWRSGAVAMDVLSGSRATPAEIAHRQSRRLRDLLASVVHESPLYRDLLQGLPPNAALQDLPVVTKPWLMERFGDWVADPRLKLHELQAFTADPARIGAPYLDDYVIWESSGSIGDPGVFVLDPHTLAVYDALESLRRAPMNTWRRAFDPMCLCERMAFVGAASGHFASTVSVERMRRLNPWMRAGMKSISFLQPVQHLVDELNAFSPTIVATYPTAAVLLAEQAQLGALRISPQEILTGGESLTPSMRRFVHEAFDCPVRNSYGASEFLPMAWECRHGSLHVNADWVILEAVDEKLRPVPAGQPSHTTLLTNLANHTQPLIRYDLGDSITFFDEPCACGSPLPVVSVQGRLDDALVMRGTSGKKVRLLPLALTTVVEDDAGVFDFQLIQHGEHRLHLRVGMTGEQGRDALERCRAVLRPYLREQGLDGVTLVAEANKPLLRGRSGKVQRVVANESRAADTR